MKLFTALLGLTIITTTPANAEIKLAKATFAGGCFWCMEKTFESLSGIKDVVSGYTGGKSKNPTYRQVSSGNSGHVEVVQFTYDPNIVSYEELLKTYWTNIDPTVKNSQFCDVGKQYRTEIFVHNAKQRSVAKSSKQALIKRGLTVKTKITNATVFYPAEEYHQNYYLKNPVSYQNYRNSCGQDRRLDAIWGKKRTYSSFSDILRKK